IAGGRAGDGQRGGGGTGDGRAVATGAVADVGGAAPPLVGERAGARTGDGEGGRLAAADGLRRGRACDGSGGAGVNGDVHLQRVAVLGPPERGRGCIVHAPLALEPRASAIGVVRERPLELPDAGAKNEPVRRARGELDGPA